MLVPKTPIRCEDVSQESEGSERESMDPNYFYQHIQNIFRNDLQQLRLEIKDVLNVAVIEGRTKSIHDEKMRNSSSTLVPKTPIRCEDVSQESEGSERESMDPNYSYQHIQNIFRNDLQQLRLEIKDVLNVGESEYYCISYDLDAFKLMHIEDGLAVDAGKTFVIDVQPGTRFPFAALASETTREFPADDAYPTITSQSLLAYKQIMLKVPLLLNDLHVRPNQSRHALPWHNGQVRVDFLDLLHTLVIPPDVSCI
ncbi:hypothetical protein QAD02_001638 [Eretmocerus hayati]|uniref:Uncharacterized protein n=1 Tax=Eretmocerus hayati TaxID=131215 RepID=A0ACC2NGZ5_9HYME|nr:hypothetical protein QAD02_001638 [Eretmocerus hayati]